MTAANPRFVAPNAAVLARLAADDPQGGTHYESNSEALLNTALEMSFTSVPEVNNLYNQLLQVQYSKVESRRTGLEAVHKLVGGLWNVLTKYGNDRLPSDVVLVPFFGSPLTRLVNNLQGQLASRTTNVARDENVDEATRTTSADSQRSFTALLANLGELLSLPELRMGRGDFEGRYLLRYVAGDRPAYVAEPGIYTSFSVANTSAALWARLYEPDILRQLLTVLMDVDFSVKSSRTDALARLTGVRLSAKPFGTEFEGLRYPNVGVFFCSADATLLQLLNDTAALLDEPGGAKAERGPNRIASSSDATKNFVETRLKLAGYLYDADGLWGRDRFETFFRLRFAPAEPQADIRVNVDAEQANEQLAALQGAARAYLATVTGAKDAQGTSAGNLYLAGAHFLNSLGLEDTNVVARYGARTAHVQGRGAQVYLDAFNLGLLRDLSRAWIGVVSPTLKQGIKFVDDIARLAEENLPKTQTGAPPLTLVPEDWPGVVAELRARVSEFVDQPRVLRAVTKLAEAFVRATPAILTGGDLTTMRAILGRMARVDVALAAEKAAELAVICRTWLNLGSPQPLDTWQMFDRAARAILPTALPALVEQAVAEHEPAHDPARVDHYQYSFDKLKNFCAGFVDRAPSVEAIRELYATLETVVEICYDESDREQFAAGMGAAKALGGDHLSSSLRALHAELLALVVRFNYSGTYDTHTLYRFLIEAYLLVERRA